MTIFSDLNLNFTPHPVTGDLTKYTDVMAVKTALKNLVQTAFYERPFNPDLGSPLGKLLFEPSSPILKVTMEKAIKQVIENYEPRVVLESVQVIFNDDLNEVRVNIYYKIINTLTPITLNFALKRTR